MKEKIFNAIFREKPAKMLIELLQSTTPVYASNLAKTIDCTYSHVVKVLKHFETKGIINHRNTDGRIKIISLTPKGKRIAENIVSIREDM